ncbi:hypothetical protein RDV64_00435 [Acuticoccus sp. MNP-M23]|uniref:hypothetical protein n=1 Tax=Acuticoccus sp. MNP-M23 TaxID=3072793 RepID=UPI002815BC41|nr:hypothetical protein [Acuticoccus sp. MNP-M23]WMS42905.1 hypothetical protein RDV64_00435 [Acuticoccus sp. MNP-M23]
MTDTETETETPQLNRSVVTFARGRLGQQVERGECWDLAEEALRSAGARRSGALGSLGDDADYVWGTPITNMRLLKPGDIIQMRNFAEHNESRVEVTFADGSGWFEEGGGSTTRAHHTVVVASAPDASGRVEVLEQNFGTIGRRVQLNTMHLRDHQVPAVTTHESRERDDTHTRERATIVTTIKWRVTGTLWAYRPIALQEE